MMFRGLVSEVVSRRMWPIPLVAILIAIAAPLLFMKSAPVGAPASTTAPPIATPGELPAGAERLVTTSDKAVAPSKRVKRKGKDPFASPAVDVKADPAATAGAAPAPAAASPGPASSGAVVINNSDGSSTTMPKVSSTGSTTTKTSSTPKQTTATTTKKTKTPAPTTPGATGSTVSETVTYVDVKFGKRMGTMTRLRVPRLQTFRAGGKVAAMFMLYSATRDVAVFAIAPSTQVAGDVECRTVKGVCRYVDIPAGSYARLTLRGDDGVWRSRRLDVVSIRELPLAGNESARPRETTLTTATCLLKGLLKLSAAVPSISADSCD